MKKKEIPKKNYVLFLLLCVVTVILCFYLSSWYKTITDFKKNNSVITTVLSEIEIESFSSYLMDNPDTIIYISSTTDDDTKKFDKQLKKIIIDNDLNSEILLLDMSKEENENALNNIIDNYLSKEIEIKKLTYPNIIIFEEGKITKVLYKKQTQINKKDVIDFLEANGIINND